MKEYEEYSVVKESDLVVVIDENGEIISTAIFLEKLYKSSERRYFYRLLTEAGIEDFNIAFYTLLKPFI